MNKKITSLILEYFLGTNNVKDPNKIPTYTPRKEILSDLPIIQTTIIKANNRIKCVGLFTKLTLTKPVKIIYRY